MKNMSDHWNVAGSEWLYGAARFWSLASIRTRHRAR
jgi:hypothetical protein